MAGFLLLTRSLAVPRLAPSVDGDVPVFVRVFVRLVYGVHDRQDSLFK